MQYLSRRTVFAGASGAALGTLLSPIKVSAAPGTDLQGCCLRADQQDMVVRKLAGPLHRRSDNLIMSSGNSSLDSYLGRALLRLSNNFGIYPGFGFLSDGDASAMRFSLLPGNRGTVLFGLPFFYRCMRDASD